MSPHKLLLDGEAVLTSTISTVPHGSMHDASFYSTGVFDLKKERLYSDLLDIQQKKSSRTPKISTYQRSTARSAGFGISSIRIQIVLVLST